MNKTSKNEKGSIGFIGLLTLAFITLKLVDKISWSWWWVLSPIWLSIGFVLLILALAVTYFWYDDRRKRRETLDRLNNLE